METINYDNIEDDSQDNESITDLLAAENQSPSKSTKDDTREKMRQAIIANAKISEPSHGYYFVKNPGYYE